MLGVSTNAAADSEVVAIMAAATFAVVGVLVLAGACWCLLVLAGSPSSTGTVLSCKLSQLQRSEPTTSRIGVASCLLGTIAKSWT